MVAISVQQELHLANCFQQNTAVTLSHVAVPVMEINPFLSRLATRTIHKYLKRPWV